MILNFNDPAAGQIANSGGKGASLARMTQGGFNVPPGLIVPAAAYAEFVAQSGELQRLVQALDYDHADVLHAQCVAIRQHLVTLPLPVMLDGDLRKLGAELLSRGAAAVRSSSTMEDLAGAAFAGQHDTYLGIRTIDDLIDAVRRCFASLWEDRAAHYRRAHGFDPLRATMAVVVQSLVESEVAGVAFSMNPITGDLAQIVINASYGLGETVVSGEGDVDQFVIDKATGAVRDSTVGEKTMMIVSSGSGTRTMPVPGDLRLKPSLNRQQLEELRSVITRIESFYAFPQDIEWAFAAGVLYVLQSRPITKFPAKWTRGESAERFPNVITPLTWDFVCDGFHESLQHSLELMGLPPFEGHWFDLFDNYVYGNETAVKLFTSGQQVAFESLDSLRRLLPVIRERYQWAVQLPVAWARDLDYYLLTLGALGAADLRSMSADQLWQQIKTIDRAGRIYFRPNIAISITHGTIHRMLFRLTTLVAGPQEGPALYDGLTCFCETKTNVVNNDLLRLAAIVRETPALRLKLSSTDRRALWTSGDLEQFPRFAVELNRFLANHGHREVDFDTYQPTWIGQPWVVLENLRLIVETNEPVDAASREIALRERQQNSERRLVEITPEDLRYFALELVRLARVYTALDDLEHYETTRLSVPFRAAIVELGRRFVDIGIIKQADHIFFLRKSSIAAVVHRQMTARDAAAEAAENKQKYEENRARTPAFALGQETAPAAAADSLRGLPGSPGVVEGVVYRLHAVEQFGSFPAGSILVARTTNPAWTPLFHSSIGVITESGGPLSHGAVTAREVGIPAVMSVRGALSILSDGDRVRVDGTTGTVTRIRP